MFRALEDEFAPMAARKGLRLRIRPTEATVLSDRTYLRRILQNLVSNAVRYTEAGCILVAARPRGAQILVEVRDSGPGIDDEDQELIFREFHRVNAHASASEGMGLGLAIVDRAAALLGHPLALRSCRGRGSTFAIRLPRAAGQMPRPDPGLPLIEEFGSEESEFLVLLVENDAELAGAMVQLLEKWRATVLDVPSVEEALELIEATGIEPDLCLVDYQLGEGMDGLQGLGALRGQLGPVPAWIVTADRSEELRTRARALQAGVITKPIPPAELATLLAELRRQRGHRA
jgi:CheY-like chemotaxis protein